MILEGKSLEWRPLVRPCVDPPKTGSLLKVLEVLIVVIDPCTATMYALMRVDGSIVSWRRRYSGLSWHWTSP